MRFEDEESPCSKKGSTRTRYDDGWEENLRLLEGEERKTMKKAADEFNLGALLSSLQDCVKPHTMWEICCRLDSTLSSECKRVGIQACRKTIENGYDILDTKIVDRLLTDFDRESPDRLWFT